MILADENIDRALIQAVRELGIDVYSINESNSGIRDEDVLFLSRVPPRIILTEDKDFGEWVFAHNVQGVSVLFLRYQYKETETMKQLLIKLLTQRIDDLIGNFTTVTPQKIRIRPIEP